MIHDSDSEMSDQQDSASQADGEAFPSKSEEIGDLAALEGLSLEQLAEAAARDIGESNNLQREALALSRRSAVSLYKAGMYLFVARKRLKGKGKRAWTKWQRANHIPVTSAWQAIRLYEEAGSEADLIGLTRSHALSKFGITRPRKAEARKPPTAEVVAAPVPEEAVPAAELRLVAEGDGMAVDEAPSDGVSPVDELGTGRAEPTTKVINKQSGPDIPPVTQATPSASEILVHIVRRLEVLERDTQGGDLGNDARDLIDRAIITLRRLRGDAAPVTEAA
jgi:hypothetical protein